MHAKPAAAIIVMAKQPQVGRSKTRLCQAPEAAGRAALSPEQAAALAEALLRDTLLRLTALPQVQPAIAITPPTAQPYFAALAAPGTLLLPVAGADIGACLTQALDGLLAQGFRHVLALNADGPSLPPAYLHQALALLGQHDVVFGPAEDGGYYLVAVKAPQPGLFEGITWSSAQVLEQSLARAQALGLSCTQTPPWYDIDTLPDLERLQIELDDDPQLDLPHTRRWFQKKDIA
jgi:uncharacterized protein